ncbi:hypothetical protein N7478_001423 [Penicillium angulare]|uniref:uncharacterized protein n=1 Tax=Penicillium angulare TaxID=116970 RepID=UPI0025403FAF|nr:uncharacterized protein N7478_001423 [Penicillium angulare]KAJ5292172.1 hypothetical protein N7478_001423 [Penicillium angulare]
MINRQASHPIILHASPLTDKRIIQSPDQIVALHAALGRGLKRQTRKQSEIESALGKRKDWFRNFQSSEGKTLIPKEVDALARITKDWELPEP